MERLLGLQLGQIIGVLILVALSEGYGRDIYLDAALVLAVLSLASALVFIRFLERWL
jgi:multisubunit Na+/H+ antiporter MnhF subunit